MIAVRSVGLVAALFIACAVPAAAENVLRFRGMDATAATMDPHAYATPENRGATRQVYEALLDVDSNLAIVPQLALTWKPLNTTTWEFGLRPDVTFHDGTPFTAADVAFSIERARAETSDFRPMSTASRRSRQSTITPSASRPPGRIRRCG
jgi:peptide/nickel transport system substrate-binding protein